LNSSTIHKLWSHPGELLPHVEGLGVTLFEEVDSSQCKVSIYRSRSHERKIRNIARTFPRAYVRLTQNYVQRKVLCEKAKPRQTSCVVLSDCYAR
jgi:hypothetical protein